MKNSDSFKQEFSAHKKQVYWAIVAIALVTFIGTLIETSMNVMFPKLMTIFNISLSSVQWLTSGYLLVMAFMMLMSAYLNRQFSYAKVFDISVLLFVVGGIIAIFAKSFPVLLLGRLIQAGCAGMTLPLLINFIFNVVNPLKIGLYMGIIGMIINIAPALGPSFGGWLISSFSWQALFIVTLIPVVILWLLSKSSIKTIEHQSIKMKFPLVQYLALIVIFTALNFIVQKLPTITKDYPAILFWLVLGIIGMVLYQSKIKRERPLLNFKILTNKFILDGFLIYALIQCINLGINVLIPLLVQTSFSVNAFKSGLILLPGGLLVALINPLFGKMLDKYGAKLPISLGLSILAVALMILILFISRGNMLGMVMIYLLISVGRTMSFGNTLTYSLAKISNENRADGNAIFSAGQQLAGSVGSALTATVISSNSDFLTGNKIVLLIFIVVTLICLRLIFKMSSLSKN